MTSPKSTKQHTPDKDLSPIHEAVIRRRSCKTNFSSDDVLRWRFD